MIDYTTDHDGNIVRPKDEVFIQGNTWTVVSIQADGQGPAEQHDGADIVKVMRVQTEWVPHHMLVKATKVDEIRGWEGK